MYFLSKLDAEVLLPTQPPFSWLILDFKRKYMEKIQDKALTASVWIWQSHRATTIWQSLVVSWDTAEALWASSNDASAPKLPLQNPITQCSHVAIFLYINIELKTSNPK